jgi:hypothetical protein
MVWLIRTLRYEDAAHLTGSVRTVVLVICVRPARLKKRTHRPPCEDYINGDTFCIFSHSTVPASRLTCA